jgi:hypothetical protein
MTTVSEIFHFKRSPGWFTNLIVPVVAVAMAAASPTTAFASYLLIAVYALKGYPEAAKALILAWLVGALNPGLAFGGEASSMGRPLVYVATAISVFGRAGLVLSKSAMWPLVLGIVFATHSLVFSEIPDISLMKSVIWALVTVTIFQAFAKMTQDELRDFARWFLFVFAILMVISWPLLVTPVGFLRNGRGFQGMLNHPQTYGVFVGILAAFTAAKILGEKKPPMVYFAILGSAVVALLLTQARTGGVAFLGGVLAALALLQVFRQRRAVIPGARSKRTALLVCLIFATATISFDRWSPFVVDYLVKGYEISSFSDLYETSRGRLVDRSLISFSENPLTGVGFGIDNTREMNVYRDPFFGLPVSAPIEKGNAYVASLEEVGLIVSAVILLWLLYLLPRAFIAGVVPLTVFCAVLLVNIGEAVFFSPGGNGLLMLLLLGWSVHQAPPRIQTRFDR